MNKPTREELLAIINELIDEELGQPVTEEQLLIDCEIDSFGYAMVWLGVNAKLGIYFENPIFPNDLVDGLDYETLTVKWIIDQVEDGFLDTDNLKIEVK